MKRSRILPPPGTNTKIQAESSAECITDLENDKEKRNRDHCVRAGANYQAAWIGALSHMRWHSPDELRNRQAPINADGCLVPG